MPTSDSSLQLESFQTFGELLKYLRRRARLTQRELSIAVKYSEAQISRLEQNQRLPDLSILAALFIPALYLEDEPETISRLIELAAQARGESLPEGGTITFSRSTRQKMIEITEMSQGTGNLPLPLNSFIGRERERQKITEWFGSRSQRLVTVTGIGGCGKTRLALETARDLVPAYRDGVWLVELASITDPLFIAQAVNAALGAPEPRDGIPMASLLRYLRDKQVLLLLDNCEQVILGAAQLAVDILQASPHVYILATSREALNIQGEAVLPLQPLTLPDGNALESSDSTRLFLDRARAIFPGFTWSEEEASQVAQICRRLDGIPLAIELAVSRLRALSVGQIAARLDDRFRLLNTGRRTALPRQQTLRAAVAWSYDLLSVEDQDYFRRLSVFAGSFDLEAANALIHEMPDSRLAQDIIARFVEKSLITVDPHSGGDVRYRLLETVREYGRERLQESGEESATRAKHFHFFFAFAGEACQGLRGRDQVYWMKRLEQEHDNLRAAMEFSLKEDSTAFAQQGLQLAIALGYFWFLRGYHEESSNWLDKFMQHPYQPRVSPEYAHLLRICAHREREPEKAHRLFDESLTLSHALDNKLAIAETHLSRALYGWREDDPSAARHQFEQAIDYFRQGDARWHLARALSELGEFAQVRQDDRMTARRAFEESLQISRELEDARGIAFALVHLGDLTIEQGKLDEAREYASEGLVVASELNDMESLSWGLDDLSIVAMCEGRFQEAERLGIESLQLSQEWGNTWHTVIRRYWLARVYVYRGEEQMAMELFEENQKAAQAANFDWGYAAAWHELGCAALRRGDVKTAKPYLNESLPILHRGHYGYSLTYSLDAFAALALAEGQPERAQILLSACDAYRLSIHTDLLPPERADREKLLAAVRALLPPKKISSLTERGQGMNHNEAIQFVLDESKAR
jgi:predicted ATPase/transcriptional regulator with XRE-family HTH domain